MWWPQVYAGTSRKVGLFDTSSRDTRDILPAAKGSSAEPAWLQAEAHPSAQPRAQVTQQMHAPRRRPHPLADGRSESQGTPITHRDPSGDPGVSCSPSPRQVGPRPSPQWLPPHVLRNVVHAIYQTNLYYKAIPCLSETETLWGTFNLFGNATFKSVIQCTTRVDSSTPLVLSSQS